MKHIGILGAGQLGRMLAIAAYPLEMQCSLLDFSGSPSAGIGSIHHHDGADSLRRFADDVDIVTYEFENIPLAIIEELSTIAELRPGLRSIQICQNRTLEKQLFQQLGIPTPAYRIATSAAELAAAIEDIGCPAVAKSTTDGYDGKGQFVIRTVDQADEAWESINHPCIIVESFVNFRRELSIVAVRDTHGACRTYELAENQHEQGILRFSTAPALHVDQETLKTAENYAHSLLNELDHVGVLTLELFDTDKGLVANEIAPRVHNSGHWSIEAAQTSQFENHMRAIAGLPLGDTTIDQPTCMINIIGQKGDYRDILKLPYAHLHGYDKSEKDGRKLGHVTVKAESVEELQWRVRNVACLLPNCPDYKISTEKS